MKADKDSACEVKLMEKDLTFKAIIAIIIIAVIVTIVVKVT